MTHDSRPAILAAWNHLNESTEVVASHALQWVALTSQGVVAAHERAEVVVEQVEFSGYDMDQVLFHFVNRFVEQ
jgi:hypothetical protein